MEAANASTRLQRSKGRAGYCGQIDLRAAPCLHRHMPEKKIAVPGQL